MSVFFLTTRGKKTEAPLFIRKSRDGTPLCEQKTVDTTAPASKATVSERATSATKPPIEIEEEDTEEKKQDNEWFTKWHDLEEKYRIGQTEAQGSRDRMENRHRAFCEHSHSRYTVVLFDGHRGEEAAEYCRNHLAEVIDEIHSEVPNNSFRDSIRDGFFRLDQQFCNYAASKDISAGAVGIFLRFTDSRIYCANTGDCRAFLSRGRNSFIELTEEHRLLAEKERMVRDFGEEGYLNVSGTVSVARAFGNVDTEKGEKLHGLVVDPFISMVEMTDKDEFIIAACDGLWDAFESPNIVMDIVRNKLRRDPNPQSVAEKVVGMAIKACKETCDNITVVITAFPTMKPDADTPYIVPPRPGVDMNRSALRGRRRRIEGLGMTH